MSYIKIDDSILSSIADAIRQKTGNFGETRIETTVVTTTEDKPITKISKTMNAIDSTTGDPNKWYYYPNPEYLPDGQDKEQETINKDSRTWKAYQITGAKSLQIKLNYQTAGSDRIGVMPGVATEFDASVGREFELADATLHSETFTLENTDSVSIAFTWLSAANARKGLLGYYMEVTGYDVNGNLITEPIEITTETTEEVPNTYTPEQMASAILQLKPQPYVAFITLSGMQTAFFNEPFTTSKLIVTAHYSDFTEAQVTNWVSSIADNTQLEPGNYTVTITYTDNSGVPASENYEINVYDLNLVSWSTGSEQDIIAMVAAADAGRINLSDYWHVGDERVISFRENPITSADNQDLAAIGFEDDFVYERTLVLVHPDPVDYDLVNDTIARKIPNFIVQFKDCSVLSGQMSLGNDVTGYEETTLASLLDTVWYNNLPDWLHTIIKPVNVKCGKPTKPPRYEYLGMNLVPYKLFLPSIQEVTPDLGYGDEDMGFTKWQYYILNPDGVYKTSPVGTIPFPWLSRTGIYWQSMVMFQVITGTEGQTQVEPALASYRIAPAFCI